MATAGENTVTMLLVSYNQESYVGEAVRSALAQTYRPLRILISDDCSTDGTFGVIERLVAEYRGPHEVRINRNSTNQGLIGHLYRCIELIDSEWVVAAAGDDISEPNRVQRIMDYLEAYPDVDAVHSGVRTMRASGRLDSLTLSHRLSRVGRSFVRVDACLRSRLLALVIFERGFMFGGSAAWRRRLWTEYPRVDPSCAEDTAIGFRAAMGGGVGYVREHLVRYRHHESNMWSASPAGSDAVQQRLRARRLRLSIAAIDQNLGDLNAVDVGGRLPPGLGEELRLALGLKRSLLELTAARESLGATLSAALFARAGLSAFESDGFPAGLRARIRGWCHRALRGYLERSVCAGIQSAQHGSGDHNTSDRRSRHFPGH